MKNLLNLKKYWLILIAFTLIFSVIGFVASVVQTQKYESTVQLLVIQKYGDQFDAFTAKRSAETVAETLSSVVYTSSFMNQTLNAPLGITDNFPKDLKERKQAWKKEINARLLEGGNFQIIVRDKDRDQAEKIAYGVAYIFVTNGSEYHGGGQQVDIKMVEKPITSVKPVSPNIYLNTILGFVAGLFTAIGIIFLLPEKKEVKKTKIIKKAEPKFPFKKATSTVPENLPIAKTFEKSEDKKGYTGEEYSENKVDEWVKSGRK
ncbi:MAG: Wzz/FepE/Etk N-terminal domain-containing protein [Patescibacteria group bacterium]|jgi:capsular polysaccharide biosynthesis protein